MSSAAPPRSARPDRPAPPVSHAPREASPAKGPAVPAPPNDDESPAGLFDDELLPLPPADGDDTPLPSDHEGLEPALPPGEGEGGVDDAIADDLPVGRAIADLDLPTSDDDSLGPGGNDAGDALDDLPSIADEGEGFENDGTAGLPDEGGVAHSDDAEGPDGAIERLDIDSLPALEPDDEAATPVGPLPPLAGAGPTAATPPPPLAGAGPTAAAPSAPYAFRRSPSLALPFAVQALAAPGDGTIAVGGEGLALVGGSPPALQSVSHPFDESAPAIALCPDPWHPGSLLLVDRRLDVYAFDLSRGLASPRPPLPGPPLVGSGAPALVRLDGPRLVAWHPSGLTLSLGHGAHWARFFHVPFVAFASDGALACAGLAESIEGRPRLHRSSDGGASWSSHDVPAGLSAAPSFAPAPWLLGCYGPLVVLGRPGRGLWASQNAGPFRPVVGGEAAFALAPGPAALALAHAPGGRVALVRADGEGPAETLAELPEAFGGPDVRLAWCAAGGRLWAARGRALTSLEPPRGTPDAFLPPPRGA
jgi:hypothetical protein